MRLPALRLRLSAAAQGVSPALPRGTLCYGDSLAGTPVPVHRSQIRLHWSVVSISAAVKKRAILEKRCQDIPVWGKTAQTRSRVMSADPLPSRPDPHRRPRGWVGTEDREDQGGPAPFCGNKN